MEMYSHTLMRTIDVEVRKRCNRARSYCCPSPRWFLPRSVAASAEVDRLSTFDVFTPTPSINSLQSQLKRSEQNVALSCKQRDHRSF